MYRCGDDAWSILRSWRYVMLPSGKAILSKLTLDQIWANSATRRCLGVEGCSRRLWLWASILWWSSAVLQFISETLGRPGILGSGSGGSGISWSSSSSSDGGSTGVVVPEVVTPVTDEPLLGVRNLYLVYGQLDLLRSGSKDWATGTPIQFSILRSDEEVMTSLIFVWRKFQQRSYWILLLFGVPRL